MTNELSISTLFSMFFKGFRPLATPIIQLPILVGTIYSLPVATYHSYLVLCIVGLVNQFYICISNDYYDYQADKINPNRTFYSGGSGVLVKYPFLQKKFRLATIGSALLLTSSGAFIAIHNQSILLGFCFLFIIIMPILYHHPSFRWSYHCLGELLQAAGTGIVLPLTAILYFNQKNNISTYLLIGHLISYFATALSTTLQDERGDRLVQKKTLVVAFGKKFTHRLLEFTIVLAIILIGKHQSTYLMAYSLVCVFLCEYTIHREGASVQKIRDIVTGMSGPITSISIICQHPYSF